MLTCWKGQWHSSRCHDWDGSFWCAGSNGAAWGERGSAVAEEQWEGLSRRRKQSKQGEHAGRGRPRDWSERGIVSMQDAHLLERTTIGVKASMGLDSTTCTKS